VRSPIWTARVASAWEQAEPDKLSEAARDLRVCRFLRHMAESAGGSSEQLSSAPVVGSRPPNGGMADVRQ